jgi:hypothetical protein
MGQLYFTRVASAASDLVRVSVIKPDGKQQGISADPEKPTTLPPGVYVLRWDLWGNPGDTVTFTLQAVPKAPQPLLTTRTYTIPAGRFVVGSQDSVQPPNYVHETFVIA